MNRSKLLTIAVIGLLLINLGTLSFILFSSRSVAPERGAGPPRGEGPKRIIVERLGFTEEQQKEYEIIIKEHRGRTNELTQQSRKLHNELFSLLKSDSTDKSAADTLIEKIALNQKEIDHLNLDHFQKIKAICKGDQVQKYNNLVDDLGHLFSPRGPHP